MQHRSLPICANMAAVLASLLVLAAVLSFSSNAAAQVSAPPETLVTLAGRTSPRVLDGTATRLSHYNPEQKLRLALFVQPPDMAGEEQFLEQLHDKTSPNFHQFLTADQWNARFGPSVEAEQAVVDWAQSQGFTITRRYPNRLMVSVEAPAGTIEKAFGVTINNYQLGDRTEFSNDSDPSIPARLSGILSGVLGLNSIQRVHGQMPLSRTMNGPDYVPGPAYSHYKSSQGAGDATKAPWASANGVSSAPSDAPALSQSPDSVTVSPFWIFSSEAYDYNALYNMGHCCNVHNDPGGSPPDTSIALVTFGDFEDSDVQAFFSYYGFAWNYDSYTVGGNTPPGQDDEAPGDLEYSTATSNSFGAWQDTAHVAVYEIVNNLYSTYASAYNDIVNDNVARVVSTSYGSAEEDWNTDSFNTGSASGDIHPIFNSMAGQGYTLIASAGDNGSADDCGDAVQVDWPASDPNFVAAGGSALKLDGSGNFVSEVAWTGDTSKGSCANNWGGGGGGASVYFAQPSWQKGLGGSTRLMPDISLNASPDVTWEQYYYNGGWSRFDGTSIVAPELAGFFTQENAYLNYIGHICGSGGNSACEPIGNPNWVLYGEGMVPSASHYPFYDITSGCNSNDITQKWNLKTFCAHSGYDQATGWGSANMLQLAWTLNWDIIPADGVPALHFTGPATNTWYNTNQTVSWTVTDGASNSFPAPGVAGFTQGWDSIPADPYSEPHGGTGNSFYSGPQYPNATSGCLALEPNGCAGGVSQGCHTVKVQAWDNQGNRTAAESYGPICYDTVDPTIAAVYSPAAPGVSGWYTGPVSVTLSATDPGGAGASGVSAIYYGTSLFCGPGLTFFCSNYSGKVTLNSQGANYFVGFSADKAGNFSAVNSQWIYIDSVAPVTTVGLNGVLNGAAWTNTVTIKFTATDNTSGVASTYYTLDNGAKTLYGGAFSVSTVGPHTLSFWSVDVAGNTEKKNTITFQVSSATVTTLTSSSNPSVLGANVTLKATVTATDPGTATGTISFYDGATLLASLTPSSGVASLTTAKLTVGSNNLSAVFTGSANYLNSSAALTQSVTEPTTTTLKVSPNPAVYGSAVTLTATVKPSVSGTPTGTVNFFDGVTPVGSATLNSSDVATLAVSTLPAGSHSLTAVYAGDGTYTTSTSFAVGETINKAASATALKSSSNASAYGASVTFTATVTSMAGTPSGSVNFFANGQNIGSGTLAGGVATFTTSTVPVGNDSITATYTGSVDYNSSNSPSVSLVTSAAATTITVASSLSPAGYGVPVIFTATVAPATSGTPAGTVSFLSNGKLIGVGNLSGGMATLTTDQLPVGTESITATYPGSADYKASASAAISEVVKIDPTVTVVSSSLNPAPYNQPVTYTAVVTSSGLVDPAGTVTFYANGASIGNGSLVNGVATLIKSLSVGTDSITAKYAGSADFGASTSAALSQVTTEATTATALVSSVNPSAYDQPVTFTATVTSTSGTPVGQVNIFSNGTKIASGNLASGTLTFTTSNLAIGTNSITAVYAGNGDFAASTSPAVSEVTAKAATTTALVSSLNPSTLNQSVTFTATVTAANGTPGGTVNFFSNGTKIGAGNLSGGIATFKTSKLPVGSNSITADYAGNADYLASNSPAVSEVTTQ